MDNLEKKKKVSFNGLGRRLNDLHHDPPQDLRGRETLSASFTERDENVLTVIPGNHLTIWIR